MKYSQGSVFRSEGTVLSVILSPLLTLFLLLVLGSLFPGAWAGEMQNVALAFSTLYLLWE